MASSCTLHDPDSPHTWLGNTDEDSRAARGLLDLSPPAVGPACFHIQQAIEKALKALVIAKKLPMPLTHNISHLIQHRQPEPTLDRLRAKLALTTEYAVQLRYPGATTPDSQEVQASLAAMQELFDWVQQQIDPPPSA